jgi:ABC-2 type transport system permease protein
MRKYWGSLAIFMKNEILAKFQYRGALWADLIFFVFGYGTQFLLIFLMVGKFGTLGGWNKYEVMLLYSMSILTYTLACAFFRGLFDDVPEKIRNGDFDQTLTKPMNPLAYEIVSAFSAYYSVHVLLGIAMLVFSFSMLHVHFTVVKLLMLILTLAGGTMIQGGILILFSSASFYLIGDNPLVYGIFVALRSLIENPISIFPRFVQVLLTVLIPFAFVSFYPAQYFLGKNDFLMFHPILQYLTLFIGIMTVGLAGLIWLYGVRRYESSGN